MVATELSDIMFGTPKPLVAGVNMGYLKEDQVNIIVHGHEPLLFESMIDVCQRSGQYRQGGQGRRGQAASTCWACAVRAPRCWAATAFPTPATS
ncbi:MAG: hypothetical protein MZV70_68705 [Desulfobacterales bacterium]|nr:hypothetical protein [Desulfobacterales bacterium]